MKIKAYSFFSSLGFQSAKLAKRSDVFDYLINKNKKPLSLNKNSKN